jgi:hypothetical protein
MIFGPTLSSRIPLRRLGFGAIVVDAAMIAIRVSSYRELPAMPGSVPFIVKPFIVLVLYLAAVTWITWQVRGSRALARSRAM